MIGLIAGWMDQLNKRERTMVMTLLGIVVTGALVWVIFSVRGGLRDKENRIRKNNRDLAQIGRLAPDYIAVRNAATDRDQRIRSNPNGESPHIPILKIAQKTSVHYRKAGFNNSGEETGSLDKILLFTGDLDRRPIGGRRRTKSGPLLYRINKQLKMSAVYVKTADLYPFFGALEKLDDLVFISWLKMDRWSQDPDFVKVDMMMVFTLRYVEE